LSYLVYRHLSRVQSSYLSHLSSWLCDRCHLEGNKRLRKDAAVQGGSSLERHVGMGQNDALHVRTYAHRDIPRDLLEDVLRKCAARQDHLLRPILNEVPRRLNDEDVGVRAIEGDVTGKLDVCGEGVDAGIQCYSAE
jgi:hypothetical protein